MRRRLTKKSSPKSNELRSMDEEERREMKRVSIGPPPMGAYWASKGPAERIMARQLGFDVDSQASGDASEGSQAVVEAAADASEGSQAIVEAAVDASEGSQAVVAAAADTPMPKGEVRKRKAKVDDDDSDTEPLVVPKAAPKRKLKPEGKTATADDKDLSDQEMKDIAHWLKFGGFKS